MKSERQQNQESDLIADKIENFLISAKEALPKILVLVGIVVVGLLAWGIYYSVQSTKVARAWTALYFSDTSASELTSIADDFSGTEASQWALQTAGDSHLAKGTEAVFSNRELAEKHYQNALEEYKKVLAKSSDNWLACRAYWGLAQAQEGLGLREEAAASYKKLTRLGDIEPSVQTEASKRAAWLESSDGEEFFVWFKENRSAAVSPLPGLPSDKPAIPSEPTFVLPGIETPAANPGAGTETPKEVEAVATPTEPKSTDASNQPPAADKPQ